MRIIGIDLGTKAGVANFHDDTITFGMVDLRLRKGDTPGMRYGMFRRFLEEFLEPPPDVVYYEDVKRHLGTQAAHVYGGLLAVLMMVCDQKGVRYVPVGVQAAKMRMTGKGNATKTEMVAAVRREFAHVPNIDSITEDAADAMAVAVAGIRRAHQNGLDLPRKQG